MRARPTASGCTSGVRDLTVCVGRSGLELLTDPTYERRPERRLGGWRCVGGRRGGGAVCFVTVAGDEVAGMEFVMNPDKLRHAAAQVSRNGGLPGRGW